MKKYQDSKSNIKLRKLITQLEVNLCELINTGSMKTNTLIKADFKIQAFEAKRIIFDDSDLVSVQVRCRREDTIISTTLLFTFSRFNDLLRFSGESGDRLQIIVSDKLLSNEEKPYVIDLAEKPIIFTSSMLELSYLIAEDNTCFSVEDVSPLSFLQQAKNLRNNIKDFQDVHLQNKNYLQHALQEIATMYRYYVGLKELNLQDSSAREKAGLQNEQLFKLAYFAAQHKG